MATAINCRVRLEGPDEPTDRASGRTATELAYDVALVRLCEAVGAEHDLELFSRPEVARRQMERALARSGIHLGWPASTSGEPVSGYSPPATD